MKNVGYFALLLFSGSTLFGNDAAFATSKCRDLVASVSVPSDEGAEAMEAYFTDAELAYRDCRGAKAPLDVRVSALRKHAVAKELRGERQAALVVLREALDILDGATGDRTEMLIAVLDQARSVETDANLRSDAKEHASRALVLRQQKFGRNSSEAVVGMVHSGLMHANFGEYALSESLLGSAVRIAEKTCGPECDALAFAYAGMYALYEAQGNMTEAKKYAELGQNAVPTRRAKE